VSRIFLSHSSNNNAEAIAVHDWLIDQGWNELFLDLHPERGFKAGQRWQDALKQAAERCELVIFLISPAWAASKWCLAEFLLAKQMSKRIFGVIVAPTPFEDIPTEMAAEWQLVDLTTGTRSHERAVALPQNAGTALVAFADDGLNRLRIGIMQAGLDPKYFKWPPDHDPERAPYRGLRPLDTDDAGIFFGREGPTVVGLDMLRGLCDAAPPRLLVILGASGAGKSSFMRAGLLPRMAREDQHFLPLPVIRPERAVFTGETGLIACLEQALKSANLTKPRSDIRSAVEGGVPGVCTLLSAIINAKKRQLQPGGSDGRRPPTIVIPIDQAEELFTSDGAKEAERFLTLLRDIIDEDMPAVIALFTIRSDNYEPLQTAPALDGMRKQIMSLDPMPKGAYAKVIEDPTKRLEGTPRALVVEEPLVQALLTDVEQGGAKDALPLLAFTLERLYLEFHGAGRLTVDQYQSLGGIKGSIETAVDRVLQAADGVPSIPRDNTKRLALLRRGLIPWLASVDPDTGAPRRRVARLSEIPADALPLTDLLVEQRLLSRDVAKDTGETVIEPAHEALLRQWSLLEGWLKEDAGLLSVMDGIKRASRDWAVNRKGPAWLTHTTDRLKAAERLVERRDLAANLGPTDLDYLAACDKAEKAARSRTRRGKALVGMLLAGIVGIGGLAYTGFLDRSHLVIQGRKLADIYLPSVLSAEKERALKSGDSFRECASCPEMVVVPAGDFVMGSPESERGRSANESPQHMVTIPQPIAVGKFVVTFDQWDACIAHGGCTYSPGDNNWGRGSQPVINVSWDNAKAYVAWLAKQTNKPYRLLTEAEWEYAARAKAMTRYSFGNNDAELGHYAWFEGNSESRAHPVGEKRPNAFGLYDMHGNVWQWTQDCYEDDYSGTPTDGSAATQCSIGLVLRGGSWNSAPSYLRSAFRNRSSSNDRSFDFGFRIGRSLAPSAERETNAKAGAPAMANVDQERKRTESGVSRTTYKEAASHVSASSVTPGTGQGFRDRLIDGQPCPMCPEMVIVPAGTFRMGSPTDEPGRELFNK
jgi:formylglycine-generating enzyme required for sulfatase activity